MRKLLLLSAFFILAGALSLQAQSLKGTSWKLYVDELHDTLTMHISTDSAYTTDGSGDVVVRCLVKLGKDKITIHDIDGKYVCPDGDGVYTYMISGDTMTMTLVSDDCSNRSNAINGAKWLRGKDEKKGS